MTSLSSRAAALLFAAASLLAVAAGCGTVAVLGAGTARWGLNLAAWGLGALGAFAVSRLDGKVAERIALGLGAAVVLATLLSPGLQGVHRWVSVGPMRLNAAQLMLPAMIVAWARDGGAAASLLVAGVAGVLAIQPDASQAAALAGSVLVALLAWRRPSAGRALLAGGAILAAAAACWRPDPLAPVAEVEGIMRLAAGISPILAVAAALAMTAAVIAPAMVATSSRPQRAAGLALTGYLALASLAPIVGAFPVPWVGLGVSSIVGAWLGVGLLMAKEPASAV